MENIEYMEDIEYIEAIKNIDYNLSDMVMERYPNDKGLINGYEVQEWIDILKVDIENKPERYLLKWVQDLEDWKVKNG